MNQAVARVEKLLSQKDKSALIVTPNSEIIARAAKDPQLLKILNSADLATPDGIGVVLAAKILGDSLEERVAGFDLINSLFEEFAAKNINFYFLGSQEGIIEQAAKNIEKKYPNLNLVGYHHGYLNQDNRQQLISEINSKQIDLLLVGMGFPLQEKFLAENLAELEVGAAVTVGGSFDVLAGQSKRAPLWVQKIGFEWFYRLLREPSRIGRTLYLAKFVLLVLKSKYRAKNK